MRGVTEVLVLHGSPGSGKSTLARAIAERLRVDDKARTDLDRLRDFTVSTADRPTDDAAREVITKAGW